MTTIHTIEDLLHVLDENPDWVEALRTRLLSRELIELPEKFTQFVAEMHQFIAEMHQFVAKTDRFVAEMHQFVAKTDRFVAEMHQFVAEMHQFVEATNRRFEALETRVEAIQEDVNTLKTQVKSIQTDIGILKGGHARTAALGEAATIAREMGLRRTKTLTQDDMWMLTDRADTSGIPTNELKSYHRADLIMEATDSEDDLCYIAVEISFTANGRDTHRAIRNAKFLTQFTGRRSYPAVAGLRRDDRIQDLIESGTVFWYQLDPDVLEAE